MITKQIKEVIKIFSEFPTIGERTATRFALYLLSLPDDKIQEICDAIVALKKEIKRCSFCFNPFTSAKETQNLCEICKDKKRERKIAIVERETDLWQLEKTKKYQGRYFILGGKMEFLTENQLGKMRIEELKKAIEEFKPEEIILAINPTIEGNLTMQYLKKTLKPYSKKITQLAKGLPLGGEIEYADEETLESALGGRK